MQKIRNLEEALAYIDEHEATNEIDKVLADNYILPYGSIYTRKQINKRPNFKHTNWKLKK